jgi:hypothetical protein
MLQAYQQCNAISRKCGMQVELAAGAAEDTQAALAADPENDLAYHLLGRWHTEMAQVCHWVPDLFQPACIRDPVIVSRASSGLQLSRENLLGFMSPYAPMLQLNFVVRALIKMVFGATLGPGSHAVSV